MQITRRRFLQGLLGVAATPVLAGLYTFQLEPYWVEYVQLSMPIPQLPAHLVGTTLVQLSDLHIGNRFDWHYISRTFLNIQQMKPDFVMYTGDFVSYETAEQFDQLSQVMQDAPLGRLGTTAVLGNHDYGHGWGQRRVANEIVRRLADVGILVLRNERHLFDGLQIVGLDDYWGTNYDPDPILSQITPKQATIVLCHNPDVVDEPVWHQYKGWILSGHTHGGQVNPPFLEPPLLPVRNRTYVAGQYEVANDRFLYINRALGHTIPVRFNVRPEVTIFTLEQA